jgi:hypothetical protein
MIVMAIISRWPVLTEEQALSTGVSDRKERNNLYA